MANIGQQTRDQQSPIDKEMGDLRFARYTLVGVIPFMVNMATLFIAGVVLEWSAVTATRVGFIIGGQASFWSHDRITYRDRFPTYHGWHKRWPWFMIGQTAGIGVVYIVTGGLHLLGAPGWLIVIGGLAGVPVSFTVSNRVSHKDPYHAPVSVES